MTTGHKDDTYVMYRWTIASCDVIVRCWCLASSRQVNLATQPNLSVWPISDQTETSSFFLVC